jgi:DNA-binding transcriptional MerR regulator
MGKLYYTVQEAVKLCEVEAHTLRYWEKEFPQLSPKRRSSMGREQTHRYYQQKDIELIKLIKHLREVQGFTIQGVKQQLKRMRLEEMPLDETDLVASSEDKSEKSKAASMTSLPEFKAFAADMATELKKLLSLLKTES